MSEHAQARLPADLEAQSWGDVPDHLLIGDWPWALLKALRDDFECGMGLRNGLVLTFSGAKAIHRGNWVHLEGVQVVHGPKGMDFNFDRGIDVRVSEIAWVADAPHGS